MTQRTSHPHESSHSQIAVTPRTSLKRHPERGRYERSTVYAVLDEALVCHVSAVADGAPCVLPTAFARIGDDLYLHGARANRLLGVLAAGAPACIAATLLDGLVFARTWFHHSMNFRSVVLYGTGAEVTDPDEKLAALTALVNKAAPGRAREARPPTSTELRSTLVVRFPVVEAAAKMRTGPALEEPALFSEECWAGELPLRLAALPPRDDANLPTGTTFSAAVAERAMTFAPGVQSAFERRRGDFVVSTDVRRLDFPFVHRFLAEQSYWARGIEERCERIAMGHSLCFGLYRGECQIGFARVMTDFGRLAYLADVFVASHARGQGLGTWLIASVLDHPDLAAVDRWLLGTSDAHGLYEPFGFERAQAGRYMVRSKRGGARSQNSI